MPEGRGMEARGVAAVTLAVGAFRLLAGVAMADGAALAGVGGVGAAAGDEEGASAAAAWIMGRIVALEAGLRLDVLSMTAS